MPTQILKSEFPPVDQWEEMEIVEDIGTENEHADTFLRWNNYGIEVHEDGLCQAYVIIQTEEGEIPKKVAEGFTSPEAVIEYFRATEGQKALTEGGAPAPAEEVPPEGIEEVAEVEGEPVPAVEEETPKENPEPEKKAEDKDEGKEEDKDEDKDDKKPVKKAVGTAPAGGNANDTATTAAGVGDGEQKFKSDLEMDKAAGVDGNAETDLNKEAKGTNDLRLSATDNPEPLGDFPVIKSWAEMQNEYNSTHQVYQHPINYCQPSAATVRKTKAERQFSDKARQYPVDTIDHDPTVRKQTTSHVTHPNAHPKEIHKSIEFGSEIPSWADMQAGYSFTFARQADPVAQNPVAKATVTKTPTPVPTTTGMEDIGGAVGNNLDSQIGDQVVADQGDAESPVPTGAPDGLTPDATPMVADFNPEQIAAQLQMEPDQLAQVLSMDGGIEAVASALQGDMEPLEALLAGEAPAEEPVPSADDILVDEDDIEVPSDEEAEDPDADDEKESAKGDARISLQSEPTDTL